jgi:hypothetical protein
MAWQKCEPPRDIKSAVKKQFRAFLLAFPSQSRNSRDTEAEKQKRGGFGDFTGKQAHSLDQKFP